MTVLPVLIAPDPLLKKKAKPVVKIDASVRKLLKDMLDTMYADRGVGLAAPQVGVSLRLVVVDVADEDENPEPLFLINPEITWKSEETKVCNEGCLSLPDFYADVTRAANVRVSYLDEKGKPREITAYGMLAVCLQHEIDHLDGKLFVDYLSSIKRGIILRKLKRIKENGGPEEE